MTQSLAVGSVLGGRYRITEHLVTSADQNLVFLGADQVLNRRVTILVASRENAAQVATSARELATGERQEDVQVLDLGLSDGRTYLITGGPAANGCIAFILDATNPDAMRPVSGAVRRNGACAKLAPSTSAQGQNDGAAVLLPGANDNDLRGLIGK